MFWARYQQLCEEKGFKPHSVLKELGISSGSAFNWKKGTLPNGEILIKISQALECSIDYLLGTENEYIVGKEISSMEILKKLGEEVERLIRCILGNKMSYSVLNDVIVTLEDYFIDYKAKTNINYQNADSKADLISDFINKAVNLLEDKVMDDTTYNDFDYLISELYRIEDEYLRYVLKKAETNKK